MDYGFRVIVSLPLTRYQCRCIVIRVETKGCPSYREVKNFWWVTTLAGCTRAGGRNEERRELSGGW